jgi:hypothetical protein
MNAWLVLRRLRRRPEGASRAQGAAPPALVVAALKGVPENYARHLARLLGQDYPRYRVTFCLESRADPAFRFLVDTLGLADSTEARLRTTPAVSGALAKLAGPGLESVEIVVAGLAERQGQKVHNLLAGIDGLEASDQVIAFVDADAETERDWLGRLAEPLEDARVGVSTGYRWLMPAAGDWASCFASSMNASVATTLGPRWRNSAWAGSMALTRATFERLGVRELWRGALNDDTLLSRASRQAGLEIAFAEGLLLPTPARYTWAGLLEFGRRQYLQVRLCRPEIWVAAALITTGYVAGWLICLLLSWSTTDAWPLGVLACVVALDRLRAAARERIARLLFGAEVAATLGRVWRLERWGTLIVSAVHAVIVWSALVGREVTWAGVRYVMAGARETRVVSRARTQPR